MPLFYFKYILFALKNNKAVMFYADIVVLHQVLNETSQLIVSGKDSPVI